MELFMKACGAAMLAVVVILALGNRSRDMGLLLSIAVCTMVALLALEYLRPVIEFIGELESAGALNSSMIKILLKAVGIGMISEIAALICVDSGNSSLGKTIQMLGSVVILWLSMPLFSALLELLQKILGEL